MLCDRNFVDLYNKLVKKEVSLKYALNIDNGLYILPVNARRGDNLECERCGEKVVKCMSSLLLDFYKHSLNCRNCSYFSNKMEKINFDSSSSKRIIKDARDNIHKKAIELLCHHLSNGNEIIIYTNCNESYKNICLSGYRTNIKLEEGDKAEEEFGFKLNPDDTSYKKADIAIINKNNEMKMIIEIYNTHVTEEKNRPTNIPWFELDAFDTIDKIIAGDNVFDCIKPWTCKSCCDERTRRQIEDDKDKKEKEAQRVKNNELKEQRRLVSEEKERKEKEEKDAISYLQRQEKEKIREKEREERLAKQEREKQERLAKEKREKEERLANQEKERLEKIKQEELHAISAPGLYNYKREREEMESKKYWEDGMWHIRV
tara:strand:+ start:4248 stop:5369 length:1122 start_codon:yes stop_codon:yes gene_type:complete